MIIKGRYITKLQITGAIWCALWLGIYVAHPTWTPLPPVFPFTLLSWHAHPGPAVVGTLIFGIFCVLSVLWDWLVSGSNSKYPITPEEAIIGAGYTNLYQVRSFNEWRRLHYIRREGWIDWDQYGNIIPGKYSVNDHQAKLGKRQVGGMLGVNVVTAYDGPILYLEWASFMQHVGLPSGPPPIITDR